MRNQLEGNIWKYFVIVLTERRNYIPVLALYFLSLPGTTAQQVGFYTGIGWFFGFLLEVPSGYLSDLIGHKRTLIVSKIAMLLSTLTLTYGTTLPAFVLGSSLMSLGFAFMSGTGEAFLHNTLTKLKREKTYGITHGKIQANASLISAVLIMLLPSLTSISLVMPIKAYLLFDVVGLVIAFTLHTPQMKYTAEDEEGEQILSQMKRFFGTGFYSTSIYLGLIGGFVTGLTPYKEPYLQSLGLPVVLIGTVMALSRAIWFIIGHNLAWIEKMGVRRLLLFEAIFFSTLMILISQLRQPYLVTLIVALWFGYFHARGPILERYYLEHFLLNKRFKATMLSIKKLISTLIQSCVTLVFGYVMAQSFSLGYFIGGIVLFSTLLLLYPALYKTLAD